MMAPYLVPQAVCQSPHSVLRRAVASQPDNACPSTSCQTRDTEQALLYSSIFANLRHRHQGSCKTSVCKARLHVQLCTIPQNMHFGGAPHTAAAEATSTRCPAPAAIMSGSTAFTACTVPW